VCPNQRPGAAAWNEAIGRLLADADGPGQPSGARLAREAQALGVAEQTVLARFREARRLALAGGGQRLTLNEAQLISSAGSVPEAVSILRAQVGAASGLVLDHRIRSSPHLELRGLFQRESMARSRR
jgi:hypothetical protein